MKEISKALFTWLVGLFNVGIYNLSDGMDSLLLALHKNGIERQANELLRLYQLVEHQQEILVILDVFKCLFMLISIVFLFIVNQPRICRFFSAVYRKIQQFYRFLKRKFQTSSRG
ncbi:hypothetical protein [Aureispira anguillae]|uniref:Uncharacterized protein n=1 Tax=Aureispira anguillae TaxID=2864201 RepID=A0A915YD91_9BACT|nr:hypothetical protein [Aureispira anguillae]BDS10967.1 hypothetical protein AsAng_0016770 [Aureispira anguillae]